MMMHMRRALLVLLPTLLVAQQGVFENHSDVGINPKAGSVAVSNGSYRVTGGGANVWGNADAFHFVYRRMTGDSTLGAHIKFEGEGVNAHRKMMLMIRKDLTPGSPYADIAVHGDGLTSLQYRLVQDGPTAEIRSNIKGATRVRIQKRGNAITVFAGVDGGDMVASGPQAVELGDSPYVGLAMCSHDANVLETGVFTNVVLDQPQRFRSKVAIFELSSKKSTVIFEQDGIMEAPNWSHDGKFLLVNTGGNLYRDERDRRASETRPDQSLTRRSLPL
jgi:TolB protein